MQLLKWVSLKLPYQLLTEDTVSYYMTFPQTLRNNWLIFNRSSSYWTEKYLSNVWKEARYILNSTKSKILWKGQRLHRWLGTEHHSIKRQHASVETGMYLHCFSGQMNHLMLLLKNSLLWGHMGKLYITIRYSFEDISSVSMFFHYILLHINAVFCLMETDWKE